MNQFIKYLNVKWGFIALLLTVFVSNQCYSQAVTNKGKEFWVAYGHHQFMEYNRSCNGVESNPPSSIYNSQNMVLYLSADQPATVTVTIDSSGPIPGNWYKKTYNIPANTVIATENMPKGSFNSGSGGTNPNYDARLWSDWPPFGSYGEGIFRKKGIHIVSDVPIVAYAHIYGSVSSGATMLLPVDSWGYAYQSINSEQVNADRSGNWMYVIAKENNTLIEITPSQLTKLGKPAGVPFQVTLMKGQIYQLMGDYVCTTGDGVDLTGTKVKSIANSSGQCFPIAVFSGSSRTRGESVPCGTGSGRDNDMQQCFPQQAWGKRYLTAPFSTASGSSSSVTLTASTPMTCVYKVVVKDPTTVVRRNNVQLTGLINGQYYKFSSNTADYIESDKPIAIGQFMSGSSTCNPGTWGDPEMVYLSPIEQAIKKVGFYRNNVEKIYANYVTLIIPTAGITSLKIDGSSSFTHTYVHPNRSGYTVVIKGWQAAKSQTIVQSDSAFTGITYGLGSAESYAYNVGTNLNNINGLPGFHNAPDTSATTVSHPFGYINTPMEIGAYIAYKPTAMVWKLSTLSSVVSPSSDISINNPTPIDSLVIGAGKFYLYRLPGTYVFNSAGSHYLPILLTSPNPDNGDCNNQELVNIELLIKPKATANFTYFQNPMCGVDSVRFNGINPTAENYTVIKWKWVFTAAPADTANIQNPVFHFPTPGTYPVKLTITVLHGGVADTTINVIVTSGSRPFSNFGANPTTVCLGQSITFSDSTNYSGTTGWVWDFGNGNTITANSNANQVITYASAGTYIVKHSLIIPSASCTADTVSKTVVVITTPSISNAVANNPTNCTISNGSIELNGLTANTSYTVNYNFNGTPTSASITANSSGVLTIPNLAIGNYTDIKVTLSTGCVSNIVGPFTLSNPSSPATPTAGSNGPICNNSNLDLTATTTTTGAVTYAWTGPNGFTSSTQNPTITNAGLNAAGTYSVLATLNGCVSSAGTIAVVVNAVPVISSSSSTNPTTCATSTGTITLTGLIANTSYAVNYLYNTNAQSANITSNASGEVIINNLPAGSYTLITATLNNCNSDPVGPFVLVDPNPPADPTLGNNGPICAGSNLDLTSSTTTTGVTYAWTGPNGFTSTLQNPTIAGATVAATGVYSLVVSKNGCSSNSITTAVTVNAIPTTPTAGSNSPVCAGSALNLTSNTTFTGAVTYNWTGPNGFTSTTQNPTINNVTVSEVGNYVVSVESQGCSSANASVTVVVNPIPVIAGSSSVNPSACATSTGSITLNGLTANTSYTVKYNKNGAPNSVTISSNGSGEVIISNLAAGTYSNITVTLNNCESAAQGPIVLADPNPPATPIVSNNGPICVGTTLNLTSSSSTSGVTYAWTGPNSFTSSVQNPSIASITAAANGTYNVTATLNNCVSAVANTTVIINDIPAIPTTSSNGPICAGSTLNLTSATTSTGTATYSWTGPNGFTSSTQNPSIVNALSNATGNYLVNVSINNCTSANATLAVVVNAVPNISGITSSNPISCATATGSITLSGLGNNLSYSVNYTKNGNPQTLTIASDGSGNVVVSNLTAGVYASFTVTINNCISNIMGPVTLSDPSPPATPTSGSNGPICSGSTLNLTSNSVTVGVSYSWTGPNGFTSTSQNPNITSATINASGNYNVTATLNNCTSAASTISVLVKPTPNITSSVGNNPTNCNSSTGSIQLAGLTAGESYTVNYTQNITAVTTTLVADASGNVIITNLPAGSYSNISVTLNGCSSNVVSAISLSDPNPPATPTIGSNSPTCSGTALNLTSLSATPGVSYAWTGPNGFTSTLQNPSIAAVTSLASGTYSVNATLNNCTSPTVTTSVIVNISPNISGTSSINPTDCNSATGSITLNGLMPNTNYVVNYNKNGTPQLANLLTDGSGNLLINNLTSGSYTNISVSLVSCISNIISSINLVDPPLPSIPSITSNAPVCEGGNLNFLAVSSTSGVSYSWTGPNGFTSSVSNPSIANASLNANGIYVVTVTKNNCTASNNVTVTIGAIPNASFTLPANVCMPNGTLNFVNNSSVSDGSSLSYVWDYGDGNSGSSSSHTYTTTPVSGSVIVKLTVTSALGCVKDSSQTFNQFFEKPIALFSVAPDTLCQGANNIFTDLSTDLASTIQTWNWDFNDGTTSSIQNPTKKYTNPGNYTVSLNVTNAAGCVSNPVTKNVVVYLQPVLDAGPSFVVPQSTVVRFNPTVNDSTTLNFLWTPSWLLSNPSSLRPNYTANADQKFTLTAVGLGGCTASDTISVKILKPVIIPNAFSPNGDGINDTWVIKNLADYPGASVEVYGRTGQMIYQSYGYSQPWDGTVKGKPLPVATYYYIITLKNGFNPIVGYVAILK